MAGTWPGYYTDSRGREAISIRAEGSRGLSVEIRGVSFTGADFDDLEPPADADVTATFATDHGALTDYELEWQMPVQVVRAGKQLAATLRCQLVLASPAAVGGHGAEELTLSLGLPGEEPVATTRSHDDFEGALTEIQRQLPADTQLKACISCAFSDYNPAGSGLSGTLACFRDNKAGYLQVSGKRDLFRVWDTLTEFVRETHLCPHYARRGPHAGYRGGFPSPLASRTTNQDQQPLPSRLAALARGAFVKLQVDTWKGPDRHSEEKDQPAAADVEAAIARRDGGTDVFLDQEDPFAYVAVSGGPDLYLVTGETSDGKILQLTDPGTGDAPVRLVVGGQSAEYPRHSLVSEEQATEVAIRFLEHADYDPALPWDIQE